MNKVLIKGSDGYYVREDGVIFGKKGALKPVLTTHGYCNISIKELSGKFVSKRIHRLVAKAFIPNPENKPEINHIDGDKTNNHVSNLEWVTSQENQIHATRVLGKGSGENHPHAKITEKDVHRVCELFCEGYQTYRVSEMTGIPRTTVTAIRSKNIWRNITTKYDFPKKSRSLSVETVEWVCRKLEEGYTSVQIRDIATNPKLTLSVIKGIKQRSNYKWISEKYDF